MSHWHKLGYLLLVGLVLLSGWTTFSAAASPASQGDLSGQHIYFAEENGELSRFDRSPSGLSRYGGLLSLLGAELFTLEWRKGIPADADLIVIVGPTTDLSPEQSARLWAYLSKGGRLLLVVDPLDEQRNLSNRALLARRGFFELTWSDLGVRARDDVLVQVAETLAGPDLSDVADEDAAALLADHAAAQLAATTVDVVGTAARNHPITAGISGDLAFHGARSIEVDAALSDATVTPLIFGPADFYGETSYNDLANAGTIEFNIGTDTGYEAQVLAAAVADGASGQRLVLIGDTNFVRNDGGLVTAPSYSGAFLYPANAQFLVNVTAWLLEREAPVLEFATPAATATVTITPTVTPTATETPQPTATVSE